MTNLKVFVTIKNRVVCTSKAQKLGIKMRMIKNFIKKTYHLLFPSGSKRRKKISAMLERRATKINAPWSVTSDKEMHALIKKRAKSIKKNKFFDAESERISKLKDRHKGERCFIVCTGPSLTIEDLEKLNNEYTFGVNSIVDAYDLTEWRPTYYTVIDSYAFKDALKDRQVTGGKYAKKESFFHYRIDALHQTSKDFHIPINYSNHEKRNVKKNKIKLSNNLAVCVYDAFTVAAMAFQIAVYMGFKEIYFLGADNSYTPLNRHFLESHLNDIQLDITDFSQIIYLAKQGFKACKEYAEKNGVKLFNATRGGALDVIERVDFDKVLQVKK